MLAAAAAWDGLATELYTAASAYGSQIAELTGVWSGPASASMTAAATPYVAWLNATATRAEATAVQAKAAAAAYDVAFGMTIPPPLIAANRAQLMALIATNLFGQNFPAIAVTEAHYAAMWAQDATAMYGYAAASAHASALTTFDQPPATTNPAQAGRAAAVVQAADTAARSLPSALQALGLPSSSSGTSTAGPGGLQAILTWLLGEPVESSQWYSSPLGKLVNSMYNSDVEIIGNHMADYEHFLKIWDELPVAASSSGTEAVAAVPGLSAVLGGGPVSPGASVGVSAFVGNAGTVGNLSVPQSWAAAAPATQVSGTASAVMSAAAADEGKAHGLLRGMPLMPGATRRAGGVVGQRYGFRHLVTAHPVAGG